MSKIVQLDSGAAAYNVNSASIKTLDANIMTVFEHQHLTTHDFLHLSDFYWLVTQEFSVFSIKRQQRQWQLKVGHYIGVIILPSGMILEILPKLNSAIKNSDIGQTRQWVQKMLSDLTNSREHRHRKSPHTKNLGQFSSQIAPLSLPAPPLSDWLVMQFLQYLTLYQPTKHYQAQIHNQASLQGRLLIKEQLRHNSMQPHKFVCERSVLSQEMLGNKLIKTALALLSPLLVNSTAGKFLQPWQQIPPLTCHEMQRLESVYGQAKREIAIQPLPAQQCQAAQQLLDFAYWLLQQSNAATGNGIDPKVLFNQGLTQPSLCLLIDMNQAFEQWTSQRIAATFQQVSLKYKPLFQAQSVWLNDAEGQACLSIRPDLLIYQNIHPNDDHNQRDNNAFLLAGDLGYSRYYSHVIDIKWKHLSNSSAISASDAYQLTSYAQAYQAEQVWLVYPVQDNERQPVALSQKVRDDENADANNNKSSNHKTNHAQLWLIPFNVLTGTINSDLLPALDIV